MESKWGLYRPYIGAIIYHMVAIKEFTADLDREERSSPAHNYEEFYGKISG